MVELNLGGTEYVLNEGVTIVGRGLEADIIIDSTKISRMHSRFIVKGEHLEIEDLGSKNGTFVNGQRIKEKKTITREDSLKLANMECSLVFPGSKKEKKETGPRKKVPSDAKIKAKKTDDKDIARKLIIVGIAVAIIIIGFVIFSFTQKEDEVDPRIEQAQSLIDEIRSNIQSLKEEENVDANKRIIENLDHYAAQLSEIPTDLNAQVAAAQIIQTNIRNLRKKLEDKNTEIEQQETAMEEFDQISSQFVDGSLPPMEALAKFENIEKTYPGTKAAELAGEKVVSIRKKQKEEEETLVSQTKATVLSLAGSEQFEEALKKADEVLNKDFKMISDDDLTQLKEAKTKVTEQAQEAFRKKAETIADDAKAGDWEKALKLLKEAYEKVDSVPGTDTAYKKAEQDINAVKDKKAAEAKEKIAKGIEEAEVLFKKRMYNDALKKYTSAIPLITDAEEKKKLERKKRLTGLFAFGKKAVIDHITKKGGAALLTGGNIQSVNEEQFTAIGEEGGVVNMKWHELKNKNFIGLLDQALAEKPDARGYTIMGYMCLESGDKNGAITHFSKAIQISPDIKKKYPDLYTESMKRLQE